MCWNSLIPLSLSQQIFYNYLTEIFYVRKPTEKHCKRMVTQDTKRMLTTTLESSNTNRNHPQLQQNTHQDCSIVNKRICLLVSGCLEFRVFILLEHSGVEEVILEEEDEDHLSRIFLFHLYLQVFSCLPWSQVLSRLWHRKEDLTPSLIHLHDKN